MAGLPDSYVYFMRNGKLTLLPHFENIEGEIPEKYAQVYNKKTGSVMGRNYDIKIFIISKNGHKIKTFHSYNYGNNPKIVREYVERYITDELTSGQTSLGEFRKKTKKKAKIKRKK